MPRFTLTMGESPVIVSGIVQGIGLGLIFAPLNTVGFATLAANRRTAGPSLFNFARNIGGSTGTSIIATLLTRQIPPGEASVAASPAHRAALLVQRQAGMAAYIDDFGG